MPAPPTTVARQAMATRFEIVLHGANPVFLRAAGEEALDEIERLEARLSLYRPSSEIARVNARAAHEPVLVSPAVFRLLEHASRLTAETEGAFDITIGPLMKCWGFVGGTGQLPDPAALTEARARVGMNLVRLDAAHCTVRFARDGVMLDLGAIGKGHAIGMAADILREAGVASALIHGGTSTVYGIGHPPEADAWKIAIARPPSLFPFPRGESRSEGERYLNSNFMTPTPAAPSAPPSLAVIPLRDEALSVSAVWGKSFQSHGKTFGHVIDPRTGEPAAHACLAAVVLPDATETDALSTALLTLGGDGLSHITRLRAAARALVASERDGVIHSSAIGLNLREA